MWLITLLLGRSFTRNHRKLISHSPLLPSFSRSLKLLILNPISPINPGDQLLIPSLPYNLHHPLVPHLRSPAHASSSVGRAINL